MDLNRFRDPLSILQHKTNKSPVEKKSRNCRESFVTRSSDEYSQVFQKFETF
jgi:hypothetical protein